MMSPDPSGQVRMQKDDRPAAVQVVQVVQMVWKRPTA